MVHKVTVNAILPGGFMTEPNQRGSAIHPEVIEGFRANIPLGGAASRRLLGRSRCTWASDASRYLTGAALVIDGGYALWQELGPSLTLRAAVGHPAVDRTEALTQGMPSRSRVEAGLPERLDRRGQEGRPARRQHRPRRPPGCSTVGPVSAGQRPAPDTGRPGRRPPGQ